jgi:DGQHR domain-containing protein
VARDSRRKYLRRSAVMLDQGGPSPIYQFSLRGDELLQIADISRLGRSKKGKLLGYQRAGVKQHIRDIAEYLNGDNVIFPNSIIIALNARTRFKKSRGPKPKSSEGPGINGTLEIELPPENGPKPGWIVDGQQRALAIAQSNKPDFAVPVNAFVTDDLETQRDQFLRVNSAKPLPRGLVTELLPEVSSILPARLSARRLPSLICTKLNDDGRSPFHGLIRRPSLGSSGEGNAPFIADNSVILMLQESIGSPTGCLFPYRNIATGETDCDAIMAVLNTYWTAVKDTFPEAWGLPPSRSRLLHGVGLRAMGRLMDKIMPFIPLGRPNSLARVKTELDVVRPVCRWTEGTWEELRLAWNELQNVPRHIHMLSNLLIRTYVHARTPAMGHAAGE